MAKQYVHGSVTYKFAHRSRKWEFVAPKYTLLSEAEGGSETAHKIAKIVNGALVRTKGVGIDGMARENIRRVNSVK